MSFKVTVQVKPSSKKELIEEIALNTFRIRVNAPPVDGKANEAVRALLAEHFQIAKSRITLVRGDKAKVKIFEIKK